MLPYGPEKGFGKTMGLAPYGAVHPGPVLDFKARDEGMSSDYSAFFSRPPLPRIVAPGVRRCEDRERVLEPYFARAAYDVQQECERQMVRMAEYAYEKTGSRNLCIAGGTALNGLANARVLSATRASSSVWIPPGCSDTGLSLGLALWGYFQDVQAGPRRPAATSRVTVSMTTPYTGRSYRRDAITHAARPVRHRVHVRRARGRGAAHRGGQGDRRGSRAGPNSARARSDIARSWPTRATRP